MLSHVSSCTFAALLAFALTAGPASGQQPGAMEIRQGVIVQDKHDQPVPGQQIIVRVKNGVLAAVTQPVDPNLRAGQRVHIEGSGEGARVVPQ